jgi:hypothetical protein
MAGHLFQRNTGVGAHISQAIPNNTFQRPKNPRRFSFQVVPISIILHSNFHLNVGVLPVVHVKSVVEIRSSFGAALKPSSKQFSALFQILSTISGWKMIAFLWIPETN